MQQVVVQVASQVASSCDGIAGLDATALPFLLCKASSSGLVLPPPDPLECAEAAGPGFLYVGISVMWLVCDCVCVCVCGMEVCISMLKVMILMVMIIIVFVRMMIVYAGGGQLVDCDGLVDRKPVLSRPHYCTC